jgi:hypothetical protein
MSTEPKKPADPKQDPRDLVIALLVSTLLAPFLGMLRALTYRLFWNWFVAPQYGDGPTLETWFGIGTLAALIMFRQDTSSKLPKGNVFKLVFESALLSVAVPSNRRGTCDSETARSDSKAACCE